MPAMLSNRMPEQITRMTQGGRRLTYCLRVIQEPERARACGSGAKSSADRRPVDPPPVVELRIFEGEGPLLEQEDVTFSYNANFFLFATLELARPVANGRIHPPPQQQVPVLTGMPVSGMAYLDRPTEAGYFIFPDLSVRHEGRYKLRFNLYEETKESKDADAEPNENKPKATGPGVPDSSFDWRLEVKSNMFTVYSAKKFPGLAESTTLSRTVAEQGCRVRIRRDVRMRRRGDGKAGGDYEDEDAYAARGRADEQDPYARERSRSLSSGSASVDGRPPYADGQRRLSGDYSQPPYPGAQYPGAPSGGHLGFGGYQGQSQPQFAQPPPPAPPQYQPAPPSYQQQPPPPFRAAPPLPPANNYDYNRQYPQSAYPTNPPREQRDSYENELRRSSVAAYPPSQPPPREFPSIEPAYNRPSYQPTFTRTHTPPPASPHINLAPMKMAPLEPKYDQSSPLAPVSRLVQPYPTPGFERSRERPAPYSQYPSAAPPALAPAPPPLAPAPDARNGKRTFDNVFSSSSTTQPLFNGMRPGSSHGNSYDDDEAELTMEQLKMQYKRADGTSYSRELPTLDFSGL